MKNYIFIFAVLLIVGCGNHQPEQACDNAGCVTQDFNSKKIKNTLDSIKHKCSEKAQLYYQEHQPSNLAIADYDDEFIAFVDTIEKIYQPYRGILVATITKLPVEDCTYSPDLSLEFARDTLWLNNSAFILDDLITGRYGVGVSWKFYYVRLQKLIDKYFNYLLVNGNSMIRDSLPRIHAQWQRLLTEDIEMSSRLEEYRWLTLGNIFKMMEQRLLFYYQCCQENDPDYELLTP